MGPAQLWKRCPFVAILNLPGQAPQSAPLLLSFSSALIGGRGVANPSHREFVTGAVFVIGMPQRFVCTEGDGMLVWEGAGGKLMRLEYTACEWVNPDLEKGVWVLQAGFLDGCAQQLTPKTQAAPLLPRHVVAYEGVTLLPTMFRRRDGEVVCRVPGCGKTAAPGIMRIHIAFLVHSETLHPPCCGFCGETGCVLRMRRVKGGGATCAAGLLRKRGFLVSSACGQPASMVCRHCLLSAPSRGAAAQWRHNMRRHCEQQHPDHQLTDERAAQWDWGSEELIVLGEGEGAFWDDKRKSRWTQRKRKQKRKKNAHCTPRCPAG